VDVKTCVQEGRLTEAIEAATAAVKAAPTDASARSALFEVLCFLGDLDRAEKQLDVIASSSMEMAYGASVLKSVLDGERRRREVLAGKQLPEFLGDEGTWAKPVLDALVSGGSAEELEKLRRAPAGTLNGRPFQDLRDGDDLLAPLLEVVVAGRYVWLEWGQIRSLRTEGPKNLRDLYGLPVSLSLATGQECEGYVPVLYPDSHLAEDEQLKLGAATDWTEKGGLVRGLGRRVLYANGEEIEILALRELAIEA
jgi:type VI secretion system protein ImpE